MTPAPNLLSLLVVDDNPGSLEFLLSALAREGVQIFTASDPEQGIDLVYTHWAQIVMTDPVMPTMKGMEVLERIVDFDLAVDVVPMTAHYTTAV